MNPNEPIDISELYHTRMVILMETGPGTNVYNQLALTEDQFEDFDAFVESCSTLGPCPEHENEIHAHIRMKEGEIALPEDIKDFYEED